jgi:hypothetical protein
LAAGAAAASILALTARAVGMAARDGAPVIAAASGFAASLVESAIAGTPSGGKLGHFGRNLLVSALAAGLAVAVAGPNLGGNE